MTPPNESFAARAFRLLLYVALTGATAAILNSAGLFANRFTFWRP